MEPNKPQHEPIRYGVYILVWLSLLIFTGLTVGIAGINIRGLAVTIALTIATVKTILVISYFMNLKFEDRMFKVMLLFAIVTLAVILFLTYSDTLFRNIIL